MNLLFLYFVYMVLANEKLSIISRLNPIYEGYFMIAVVCFTAINLIFTKQLSRRVLISQFPILPMNGEYVKVDHLGSSVFVVKADNQYISLPIGRFKILPENSSPLKPNCLVYRRKVSGLAKILFVNNSYDEYEVFIPKEEIFHVDQARSW